MKKIALLFFFGIFLIIIYYLFLSLSSNVPVFYLPWQKNVGVAIKPAPLKNYEESVSEQQVDFSQDPFLKNISLPEGFSISYFAESVPNARSLATNGDGSIVFVGTRTEGKVYALVDSNKDFVADEVVVIAEGLNNPNGVAYKNGDLYVAEISRILVFKNINQTFRKQPSYEVIFDSYPSDGYHGWKYISFGPDGLLYVPVGVPCNVCDPREPYGTMTRLDVSNLSQGYEIIAKGIRNTVGFDWHPQTNQLWFTDNGRDLLGDNIPPDEVNAVGDNRNHFGFPYCHGSSITDPTYGRNQNCDQYTKPIIELGPHVAALAMKFYRGDQFPKEYRNKIFIAEHGSWNRSNKIGYRVTTVDYGDTTAHNYSVFAQGWLDGGQALGRPVDILELQDGSMLISDDMKGSVYRISFNNQEQ